MNLTAIRLTNIISLVPACSLMAPAKGVYVVPCLLACKGYFIRGETNDLAIFLVELAFAFDECPCQKTEHEGQPRRGPKFRPWKVGERVKVKVVNSLYGGILRPSISVIHTVKWISSSERSHG